MKMLKLLRVAKLKKILSRFDELVVSDAAEYFLRFCRMTVEVIVMRPSLTEVALGSASE